MVIVETPAFTRRVQTTLTDDEYRELQFLLARFPDAGVLHPRQSWPSQVAVERFRERQARGGTRIIYYWAKSKDWILMLFLFKKNERSDLTKDQLKKLGAIVSKELL